MSQGLIAGHMVALREFGIGGSGPRVLALHCALGHGGAWAPLAAALPGWQLTAPDLPGHGGSAPPGEAPFHDLCTEIGLELAQRMAAEEGPLHLLGHSLGATVALRMALASPGLFQSLTLVEPVLFAAARGTEAYDGNARHFEAVAQRIGAEPEAAAELFHEEWGAGLPFRALPERSRKAMAAQMYLITAPADVLGEDAANLLAPGGLEGLELPVLLAEGEKSPPVMAAILDVLCARIPGAKRLSVAGARHMLPITHPAPLAGAMRDLIL